MKYEFEYTCKPIESVSGRCKQCNQLRMIRKDRPVCNDCYKTKQGA